MSFPPRGYLLVSEQLDDRPDFASDWRGLCLVLGLGYFFTVCVHLLGVSNWAGPEFRVGAERLLSTHDAYCWLAGAKGVNGYARFGMARLAALLASLSGQPLWAIGFWSPPFFAGLTAVATGLWGWRLAGARAAIIPALLGALAPGFFFRSRLGYFDSDVFTELMPLVLGFFLATLLAPFCSRAWRPTASELAGREAGGAPGKTGDAGAASPARLPAWLPWVALAFGLFARVAHFAHDDVQPLGVGLYWLALGLVAVVGLPGRRVAALRLLFVYGLAAYAGPRRFGADVFSLGLADLPGLMLTCGLAYVLSRPAPPRRLTSWFDKPWPWLVAIALLALAGGLLLPLGAFWAKAASYFKPVADIAAASAPKYPGITQSIREAKNVADVGMALAGMAVSTTVGGIGVLGLLGLLAFRPAVLLLAPTALLGFSSLVLGTRFTMFGGPVLALGLGAAVHWAVKGAALALGRGAGAARLAQILVAGGCLLAYAGVYAVTPATAVLSAGPARALIAYREAEASGPNGIRPNGPELWTWWDFGYATQYFAERMTPCDGGRHAGRDIYATALALTTDSYRQAAQIIRLSASRGDDPAKVWDTMPATAVRDEIRALREHDVALPPVRPQHLVVAWENLLLLHWISYYGSWDVVTGQGRHAGVSVVRQAASVDRENGTLTRRGGGASVPLASAEILSDKGGQRLDMPEHPGGLHLVVNAEAGQAVLLDDAAYGSMAVQLLIGDPARPEAARYFKLLHEGFPLVRIYEVLPGPSPAEQAKAEKQ